MEWFEIVLLLIGVLLFVLGFVLPNADRGVSGDAINKSIQDEVKVMLQEEIKHAKVQIKEIVEESVDYGMEKSERAFERITNDKISAISEYSDSVLTQIHKNHSETLFLYDMIQEKSTVAKVQEQPKGMEIERTVSERVESTKTELAKAVTVKETVQDQDKDDFVPLNSIIGEKEKKVIQPARREPELVFQVGNQGNKNSNEKILAMYNEGKSNMAIAKELDLGIGEVKLVIDLFREIK